MVAQSICCFLPLVADHCVASTYKIYNILYFCRTKISFSALVLALGHAVHRPSSDSVISTSWHTGEFIQHHRKDKANLQRFTRPNALFKYPTVDRDTSLVVGLDALQPRWISQGFRITHGYFYPCC